MTADGPPCRRSDSLVITEIVPKLTPFFVIFTLAQGEANSSLPKFISCVSTK